MARKYEQRRRADSQEETRRRIATATAELHATVGPARTTISAIAERAGVQLVRKPRGVPHAFWNRTDEPARLLELITPAGFETYFAEIAPLLPPAVPEPDFERLVEVWGRYGLAMDPGTIETISRREGLDAPAA